MERLVVVGGDAGGMSAASQARRLRDADDLAIVAFERGQHVSYSACGIPYLVGDLVDDAEDLVVRTAAEHAERDIVVELGHEVVAIDTAARRVTVRDVAGGAERTEAWDHLVVATGATPDRPDLPGIDAAGIHGVQTLDDGIEVDRAIERERPERIVVVGGGYIGLEMAEAFIRRGISTSLVCRAPQPMPTLDPDMGVLVANAMRRLGIELHLGTAVKGFEADGGHVRAVSTEAGTLPADLVLLGLGVRPNSALAEAAGIPVGSTGGIVVDRRMHTSAAGVWATGDCVESTHLVTGKPVAIALGTHANKQGRVCGTNIGGGYATFPGVIGTAASKICEWEVARTGLGESEAADAGFVARAVTIESSTRAGYYPDARPVTVKLVVEERTGRLLGGQIVGGDGAAKRIDVIATAVWNRMTVDEVVSLDLAYAPPFSPTWDPVLVAARKAAESV